MNGCDKDTGPEHVAGGCGLIVLACLLFWAGLIWSIVELWP